MFLIPTNRINIKKQYHGNIIHIEYVYNKIESIFITVLNLLFKEKIILERESLIIYRFVNCYLTIK